MKYITGITDYKIEKPTAISLGKFDGIHKGHRCLVNDILKLKDKYSTVIYTFDMNPAAKVSGNKEKLLTTNFERKELLDSLGIDYLIECPFNDIIRNMDAKDFLKKIVKELSVKYIAVGEDCRFGHNRVGDCNMLIEMSKELGYEIKVFPKEKYNERDISSTFIREEILKGNIKRANELLGYSYSFEGIVEHGSMLGRKIGFPTINIVPPSNKILPPNGVYVSKVVIDNEIYDGVTNIGVKPTVNSDNKKNAETFIIDFNKDVYGKFITVELLDFIRYEQKFESIEILKKQLAVDIKTAKEKAKYYKNVTK